ncbi:MAG: hypothetical protein PWQ17_2386 [Anaerophaga sp.]|nr:hypothetical protein [Anaerophaga sp.]
MHPYLPIFIHPYLPKMIHIYLPVTSSLECALKKAEKVKQLIKVKS